MRCYCAFLCIERACICDDVFYLMACMLRRMLLYSNALVFKARPDDAGYAMMDRLSESGVHVTLLMDCAVARCVAAVSLMVSSDWLIIYF